MNINDYYIQELHALRTMGKEFSEKNPGLSSFLAEKGQDPDVERLLEGFSFLTGRLRQSMDKEFPELTHGLTQLLWPNYLQPIPSYTIIEFNAEKSKIKRELIPKNTKLLGYSKEYKTTCPFHTSYDVSLYPIAIDKVQYNTNGYNSTIELDFKMISDGNLIELDLGELRFYLGGSEYISQVLNLYLHRYVENLELSVSGIENPIRLDTNAISTVGFDDNQNILPKQQNVFYGYMLLQEYFCYRDKFNFVNISGFEKMQKIPKDILAKVNTFKLKIHLTKHLEITEHLTKDNFKLFCTPAINIFETEAVPIRKNNSEEDYELIPAGSNLNQSEVFAIRKVEGWATNLNLYQEFLPFGSFEHGKNNQEYYYLKVKLSDDNKRIRTFIRFAPNTIEHASFLNEKMTVAIEILATNKDIPSFLSLGNINKFDASSTISGISFQNITIPTKSFLPPLQGDFLWRIISNMSLNYLSLGSVKTFRTLIESYDFPGFNDILHKRKTNSLLEGLENISYKTSEMIHEGLLIRGIETSLEMNPDRYTSLGEAYILGNVLNEFLTLYCNINTFHRFELKINRNDIFTWKPRLGKQTLM